MQLRDPLPKLIAYNLALRDEGRAPERLRAKLDRLCASPVAFLRGTFHLFVADWQHLGDDPLSPGPDQPIVGDVHLENFGAYRAADGQFVFDVNDFDETARGQPAFDLCRLATSFLLADEKGGELRALSRIDAFVESYLKTARTDELGPVLGKGMPQVVRSVLAEAQDASRAAWLSRRVDGTPTQRRFRASAKYVPIADEGLRAAIATAVREFAEHCRARPGDCPSWPQVLDVAERIAGTGSMGRLRYAVLMPGKGERAGKEIVLELKEVRPSALDPDTPAQAQAERVVAHTQLMQGSVLAYLGRTTVGALPFSVRELQPTEAKIDASEATTEELDQLCAACGIVLGRAHCRGNATLPQRLAGRDRSILRRVAAFALRYAELVEADHAYVVARRRELDEALRL